jgi:hypothetical protein
VLLGTLQQLAQQVPVPHSGSLIGSVLQRDPKQEPAIRIKTYKLMHCIRDKHHNCIENCCIITWRAGEKCLAITLSLHLGWHNKYLRDAFSLECIWL